MFFKKNKLLKYICILFFLFLFACNHQKYGIAGNIYSFETENIKFNMVSVPSSTFPKGIKNDEKATVKRNFLLGQTEVTNELLCSILQWAYDNKYFSKNRQDHNFINSKTIKYGSRRLMDLNSEYCHINFKDGIFSVQDGFEKYPAIEISWFGAIMACNWLTEMTEGKSSIVYSGINNYWKDEFTICDSAKSGFRLPTYDEWELAAKYIDGIRWLSGSHASGDISAPCYDNINPGSSNESKNVSRFVWFTENSHKQPNSLFTSQKGTHPVGSAGSTSGLPLSGNANQLGIYDMSGNVWEWTFTKFEFMRYIRGGCWYRSRKFLQSGKSDNYRPEYDGTLVGFRLAKNNIK